MGRPKKPTKLKLVTGNTRKDRANPNEPEPKAVLPDPPDWLSKDGTDFWNEYGKLYYEHGLLTELSTFAFGVLCQKAGEFIELTRECNCSDPTVETHNGIMIPNPLRGMANTVFKNYMVAAKEFGGTPASLPNVSGTKVKKADEFEQFLNKKGKNS